MTISRRRDLRAFLLVASALGSLAARGVALAQTAPANTDATAAQSSSSSTEVVVTAAKTTRSAVVLGAVEMQKLLPGINPLKAIQTLPGVLFETADPWGNNEQNEEIFVHGFSTQQLGYTMDGVPLGDQQYGNYNGLSPSRALTSENVSKVVLSSGAGALGVASTSNLGGAIETFSSDPKHEMGGTAEQVLGSYATTRSFLRIDSGDTPYGALYVSYLHQDARAWDFHGHQRGDQVNAKYVHDDAHGKLTIYGDWSQKVEPNEDATSFGNQQTTAAAGFTPYTRPFQYPNLAQEIASLNTTANTGTPPAAQGNNFSNYFSAAQRRDALTYIKYDYNVAPGITWSNQAYYHNQYGRGIVAGPINQAGLPGLFATYFPSLVVGGSATSAGSLQNISNLFGGTGLEVRTTEYHINREGLVSTFDWQLGQHNIEAGLWYEHNESGQHRVWYPFSAANNDLTPYSIPSGAAAFTQDAVNFTTDDVQIHIQDQWRILPTVLLQAGFKSSLQTAGNDVLIQQKNLPTVAVPVQFPTGSITSNEAFLPQFGAVWDVTDHEQMFANIQNNVRQFIPYSQGGNFYGTAPWSLGTQAAFNLFKDTVKPESSWTYEVGLRTHRSLDLGFLTGFDGQASFYHVDFSNRILNVAPYNFINPGPSILVNVGGVTTNGVDVAGTLNFGSHVHLYDAVSYNKSTYDSNYNSGTTTVGGVSTPVVVATGGKVVPGTPDWLNKTILSANFGPFEAQVNGDYIGKRFATYLNDISVKSTFVTGLEAGYTFDALPMAWVRSAKLALNITNLADTRGVSTLVTTSASGGYQAYPIAPRMAFVTLTAGF
jgi:outer membrane receptor protein involved in Fe transport